MPTIKSHSDRYEDKNLWEGNTNLSVKEMYMHRYDTTLVQYHRRLM